MPERKHNPRHRHTRLRLLRTLPPPSTLHDRTSSLLVLEGHEPGGQLSITTLVENFPRLARGHPGPGPHREHEEAGRPFRRRAPHGPPVSAIDLTKHPFALTVGKETIRTPARSSSPPVQAPAGSTCPSGAGPHRSWRQLLRHLRWLLCFWQRNRGHRRRRLRHGRGAVPDALCHQGHAHQAAAKDFAPRRSCSTAPWPIPTSSSSPAPPSKKSSASKRRMSKLPAAQKPAPPATSLSSFPSRRCSSALASPPTPPPSRA